MLISLTSTGQPTSRFSYSCSPYKTDISLCCQSLRESASPLLKEIDSSQFLRQVFLIHRLAVHGVVLVALAVAQILHQPGGRVPQVQRDGGQGPLVVSQACFDVVVGAVHLNGLRGSGKIDHTLGQKHLGQKGNIMKVPGSFCPVEYFMTSLILKRFPLCFYYPLFLPTVKITTCDGEKKFLQEARG